MNDHYWHAKFHLVLVHSTLISIKYVGISLDHDGKSFAEKEANKYKLDRSRDTNGSPWVRI